MAACPSLVVHRSPKHAESSAYLAEDSLGVWIGKFCFNLHSRGAKRKMLLSKRKMKIRLKAAGS